MDNKGGVNDDEQEGQPSAFQCFPSSKHDHRLSAPAPFSSSPVTSRQLNNAPRVALTEKVHITNHREDFQLGRAVCAITDPVGPRLQANVKSLSSEVIQDNWSMNDISSQNIFRNVMNYCDPKFPQNGTHPKGSMPQLEPPACVPKWPQKAIVNVSPLFEAGGFLCIAR